MAIEQVIDVSVAGLGEVGDLADALDKAAESAGKLKADLAGLGGGAASTAGADKFASAWDDAAGKVSASVDKISAAMGKLDELGALAGAAGPADLVAKWDSAAADIGASIDKISASAGKLDDLGAGAAGSAGPIGDLGKALDDTAAGADKLGASAAPAADGIKGIGTSSDEAAAQLAEFNAVMAETAAMQDRLAKASVSNAGDIAAAQRLNTVAAKSASDDAIASQAAQSKASKDAAADAEASATKYHLLALGGAAALGYGIYDAAKLQTSVTRLYTTAGESAANLPMMSAGILKLSGQTNTSQAQLGQGAYMAESAGFHGQSALNVLKAAAEGAQAEGAPLSETTNALTSLLNAYGMKGSKAPMQAMDEIISMVSRGKMTMSSAVSALPSVLPAASAAKLSFADVGGALSTMTSMGVSPDRAAQNLSHVITSIMNPSGVQTKEMQQLGLNPVSIENNLGKKGLTGTLTELSDTVMKSMGPAGDVMFKTFNQSQSAAADASKMISAMPPAIRSAAQAYADGKTTAKQWNAEVYSGGESAKDKNLLQQFATTENSAKGFNDLLKSGSPDVQTYAAAMDKLLGGQTGLNVAMELTGQHMPVMKANTDAIAQAAQHAGANVQGWSKVQGTLNFQLGSFQKQAEAVATQAGQVALPAVTSLMHGLSDVGGFLASNPGLTKPLVETAGVLGGVAVAGKVASAGATALSTVGKVAETLKIPGLSKLSDLGNVGKSAGLDTAATGLKTSATDLTTAAGKLSTAAEKFTPGEPSDNPVTGGPGEPVKTGAENSAKTDVEEGAEGGAGFLGINALGRALPGMAKDFMGDANPITAGVLAGLLIRGFSDSQAPKGTGAGDISKTVQKGNPMSPDWLFGGLIGKAGTSNAGLNIGNFISRAASQASQMVTDPFDDIFGIHHTPAKPLGKTPAGLVGITDTLGEAMYSTATAGKNTAPGNISSVLAQLMGKPVKLAPPDLSSLTIAKEKAAADARGITLALEQAMHKPVKAVPPDLSAYASAKGPATADGVGVSVGFAQGIESGKASVVAAAASVAAAAATAMHETLDSHSPSKVTQKIGSDAAAGFVVGLEGGKSAVDAAATALGKNVAKAADIASIDSNTTKLLADVPKGDTGLTKMLKADETKLTALANQRAKVEAEITDSQQIAQQAISSSSIMNAASYTPALAASNGPQSSAAAISGLQSMLADQKAFTQQIGQLQKDHLNATSLNQIVQSGASACLPVAEGITQGGKSAVAEINKLESQLQASASKLGDAGAPAMYQAGVDAGKGVAQGLDSQLGTIDAAIKKMANAMVTDMKNALKSHSPSLVFAEIGMGVPQGAAMGVDSGTPYATAAVGRMGSAMAGAYRPSTAYAGHGGGAGGGSGGGGSVTNHYNVTVHVQGSVMSENELVSTVQKGLLTRATSNWQAGVILPGRAG